MMLQTQEELPCLNQDHSLQRRCEAHSERMHHQQLQLVRRQQLIIEGAVLRGVRIQRTAGPFDIAIEFAPVDVLRPFEEQVLEKVGHARPFRGFVFRSHVVHDGDGHDGRAVVFMEDDMQAVGQIKLHVVHTRRLGGQEYRCTEKYPGKEHEWAHRWRRLWG